MNWKMKTQTEIGVMGTFHTDCVGLPENPGHTTPEERKTINNEHFQNN